MAEAHGIVRVNGKAVEARKFTAPTYGTAYANASQWAATAAAQRPGATWQVRKAS